MRLNNFNDFKDFKTKKMISWSYHMLTSIPQEVKRLGTLDYVSPFLFSLNNSSFNVKNIIAKICCKKSNYSKAPQ